MNKSVTEKRLANARIELEKASAALDRARMSSSWSTKDGMSERSVSNVRLSDAVKDVQYWQSKVEHYENLLDGINCGAWRVGQRL